MMVSTFATGLRLTLATVAARKGNEVDAALEVLGLIDLKGMIVTGDALHCNRRMVDAIVAKGGDYCFTLKAHRVMATQYSDAWRPTVPIDGDPPYRGGDPACGRRERHRWVILRPT